MPAPLVLENIPALKEEVRALAQLIGGDRVGERAAGIQVRQQHGLLRREDGRGLRHEVHAAEGDDLGLGARGLLG